MHHWTGSRTICVDEKSAQNLVFVGESGHFLEKILVTGFQLFVLVRVALNLATETGELVLGTLSSSGGVQPVVGALRIELLAFLLSHGSNGPRVLVFDG